MMENKRGTAQPPTQRRLNSVTCEGRRETASQIAGQMKTVAQMLLALAAGAGADDDDRRTTKSSSSAAPTATAAVDVGSRKQLLIDDSLLASITPAGGAFFEMHAPQLHELGAKPLLAPDSVSF